MVDGMNMMVSGVGYRQYSRSLTAVLRALTPELAKRLDTIRGNYVAKYGLDGEFERMNNRTVAQILDEYEPVEIEPIASREVDGVRFELFDAPSSKSSEGENRGGQKDELAS